MATTSLWHIEGRLKDLIAYVENPEKTVANNTALQPLREVMSYVSRPEVTEQGEYVSTINCLKEIALQQIGLQSSLSESVCRNCRPWIAGSRIIRRRQLLFFPVKRFLLLQTAAKQN